MFLQLYNGDLAITKLFKTVFLFLVNDSFVSSSIYASILKNNDANRNQTIIIVKILTWSGEQPFAHGILKEAVKLILFKSFGTIQYNLKQ